MSDTMLCGVLRMPPELWINDPMARQQVVSRMIEAAEQLEIRADEIERLRMLHATDLCELQRHLETARDEIDRMDRAYIIAHNQAVDNEMRATAAEAALKTAREALAKIVATDRWQLAEASVITIAHAALTAMEPKT